MSRRSEVEARRNALLADIGRDAALERSDFLVRAGEQLERFMAANVERVRQLGGLVLIDEDPDYLAVAPDGTFRSRSRVFDEDSGEWVSETEIIETAAELAEIYNPADVLQAFTEAQQSDAGPEGQSESEDEGGEAEAEREAGDGPDPYAGAADSWAAGQPAVREAHDEETAAVSLYELALEFQERSQRAEGGLIEQFENASAALMSQVGTVVLVDDEDEHLALSVGGFRGRVIPEGESGWQDIGTPDQIVRYYDPTDVFGDLAEALVDAYPAVADEAAEDEEDEEGDPG
jgi:hypothetical protein